MIISDAPPRGALPDPVKETLQDFETRLGVHLSLWIQGEGERTRLYPQHENERSTPVPDTGGCAKRLVRLGDGPAVDLELRGGGSQSEALASVVEAAVERAYNLAQELRFFTLELSERYEEINLLYSISETLGSILRLEDAARVILGEVCDVLGAQRGSLWVHDAQRQTLRLTALVGDEGQAGPPQAAIPGELTSRVFRQGRPVITAPAALAPDELEQVEREERESLLSVPIRYTPPAGVPRTVGVINLIGRRHGGRFTASDQKLLSAVASQVGAALENNRLIQESLAQERVAREMELAHDLQMKLLPAIEKFEGADVAALVEPAESVGGDFYHLFKLQAGNIGVMIGDVSSHGFPAALIMALSMSAASIYASVFDTPGKVLRHIDDALRDELESTEMYLTLFYGVIDPGRGRLVYSNAGHPHAFLVHGDGTPTRLTATDPPVGIAGPEAYGQQEGPWEIGGDLLVLFTDGLADTLTIPDGGKGETLVLDEVVRHQSESAQEIVQSVFALARSTVLASVPSDDRTAIVVRV